MLPGLSLGVEIYLVYSHIFLPSFAHIIGTLRYEDGELGRRRAWMGKTRSSPVVHAKNKILKIKQFSLGTATAIFLSQTNISTFKDARTVLLESYLGPVQTPYFS